MDRKTLINFQREKVQDEAEGEKVLFITTRELTYIRNAQEIDLLQNSASELKIIGSDRKSYIIRLIKVYFDLIKIKSGKYDIIFIGFAPQLVLPFWKFKFRKNCIWVDFFISMYDTFVCDRKKFKENSFVSDLLKKIDRQTLRLADKIFSDTNVHGEYFRDELGADAAKLQTLYLEADKKIYYPRESDRPADLEGKFIVLYFGSVLPLQGVDIVLEAYDLLKEDDRFYFYMIGPVGASYRKPESKNIEYIDWLSQEDLADYIARADLCLAGHFSSSIAKADRTIPGKAYIFEAMKKPMILGDTAANHELFTASDDIIFVKPGAADRLASAIEEAFVRLHSDKV